MKSERSSADFVPRLLAPVDIASLAVFRISFGLLMVWEVIRYFQHDWIQRYYITPRFHFTYYGFGWVRPLPGDLMFVHFAVMGGLAACIAAGLFCRTAAIGFCLTFTYVFLLEQARYLNHFYLIALLSALLAVVPANRAFSLDALFDRLTASDWIGAWALWLLRFQVGVAYCFAGVAKLSGDWLHGEPMHMWLAERADFPIVGRYFHEHWLIHVFAWGSAAFDLMIVPLLLWRRSRPYAVVAAVGFHLMNWRLFTIGVFPPLMIAATLLFLEPGWPRTLAARPFARRSKAPAALRASVRSSSRRPEQARRFARWITAAYVLVQLLIPLRHFLYPGDVNWTEEGHRFSWHMKLRDKEGDAAFFARDLQHARTWRVDPSSYLARWQYEEMATRPDMILQFAHYLGGELRAEASEPVEVRVRVFTSLNGRRPQALIDPGVDLTRVPRSLRPASWIVPLSEPLPLR